MIRLLFIFLLLTLSCDSNPVGLECEEGLTEENGECVDVCGVVDGPGYPLGTCDCDGNGLDCEGVCGGDSVEDDCGVCNGDNSTCSSCDSETEVE